ncbi:hypothetical protein [Micromonospora costi]|uniref:Uncharacterized protein n=1 Tax=Micromonospora costi TaxID=1530042 RepID=A0A3B0A6J1_9ACTN|nr:hypothetical protein [Micromonospora costi]RKN55993.1 hypothetical protein D7193_15525 [Micromonospora costi]
MPDQPFLTPADIAVIGARVQGVESMQPKTISQHLFESRKEIPLEAGGTRRGKFADDPFPPPDAYAGAKKKPWWALEREQEIVAWFERHPRRRPGDGIGGARRKADRQPAAEQPVRRVVPSVTVKRNRGAVEVTAAGRTRTFEALILRRAVELRQEHPRAQAAVVDALVAAFEMSKTRAREYASAAQRVIDAGVSL